MSGIGQLRVKVQTLNLWRFFKYFLSFPIHRRCFLKKMFLKFSQENTCVGVSFFSLKTYYFIKKRLQQRGFHVKFAKFLRTPILKNISERLLLKFMFCIKIKGLFTAWSVQIRSYFWSEFSGIQSEYMKIRTRNNSLFGHFSRSDSYFSAIRKIEKLFLIIHSVSTRNFRKN